MTYYNNIPLYKNYNANYWTSLPEKDAFPYYTGSQNYSLYLPANFNLYSGWASNYTDVTNSLLYSSNKPSLLSSYSEWQKYGDNNTLFSFNSTPNSSKYYSYAGLQNYYTNSKKSSRALTFTSSETTSSDQVSSDKGQAILDFGKQYVNKTQSQMRKIMQGQGYSFHTGKWCADFVSFIAGKSLGEDALPDWYKECNRAYVPAIENAARKNGAIVAERKGRKIDTSNVKPGNLAIINWEKDNSRVDHVGYVVKIEGNKVYTLEGNTGGQVAYKVRDISLFHSFVDIG